MEPRILLKKPVGRLAIIAGGTIESKLLGALNVIGEDTVIAVYQHGEHGVLVQILPFRSNLCIYICIFLGGD